MKYVYCLLVIISTLFFNSVFAVIDSINTGPSHWIKSSPKDIIFEMEITADKEMYKVNENACIKINIRNISGKTQNINLSNIHFDVYNNNYECLESGKNLYYLSEEYKLKNNETLVKKVWIQDLYSIESPQSIIIWAYYNLPDDNGINSNDLKITFKK